MLKKGTIVEIFEDPFIRMRKEANAEVIKQMKETVAIVERQQCYCYEYQGDNVNCPVHGKVEIS
jgi:hypothetical protein